MCCYCMGRDTFLLCSGLPSRRSQGGKSCAVKIWLFNLALGKTLTAPCSSSTACHCHINGSFSEICDSRTGQCKCKANVIGRRCDICKVSDKKWCFISAFILLLITKYHLGFARFSFWSFFT